MKIYLGCAGFMYREWKPDFYPQEIPQRKWLEFYASQFNSLEINSSFYKFPEAKNLKKFYDETAEKFLFSLKVPRLITHYRKLENCEKEFGDFYTAVRDGLKEKIGCVLFQFPPLFAYTDRRLELLIQHTDKAFRNVVEFRNASWFTTEVLKTLGDHNIIVSGLSHPALPDNHEIIKTSDTVYYRFHGIPKLFYSEYSETELDAFAGNMKKLKPKEAFIYFNNTASMAALHNAKFLKGLLK